MRKLYYPRPGSHASWRWMKYRPGEGAVYEKAELIGSPDRQQWMRKARCLTPRQRQIWVDRMQAYRAAHPES